MGTDIHEVHMYSLYFEKDSTNTCIGAHRHDFESVVVQFKNGAPHRVSTSAHGKWADQKWWDDVPKHFGHNPKIVYHKEAFRTSSFRFAKKSTEHCDWGLKLIGQCWNMPPLVSWEYMKGPSVSNTQLKKLFSTNGLFDKAKPTFSDAWPTFHEYVKRSGIDIRNDITPKKQRLSYRQLKTLGLCVGVQGKKSTDKKVNGARVQLESCQSTWRSQQWARDSSGRLVNQYSGKCLEAGNTDTLYSKAFIFDCHSGQHQQWWALNNGRYQNKKYRGRYLGVAYCGERSDKRSLELRSLERGNTQCGCAQTWNKSCSVGQPSSGFCNYGPDGTGATSNCSGGAEGGAWCNISGANCAKCSGRWCT